MNRASATIDRSCTGVWSGVADYRRLMIAALVPSGLPAAAARNRLGTCVRAKAQREGLMTVSRILRLAQTSPASVAELASVAIFAPLRHLGDAPIGMYWARLAPAA